MKAVLKMIKEIKAKESIIIITSLILMYLYIYHLIPAERSESIKDFLLRVRQAAGVAVLFFLVPAGVVKIHFHESLREFGLQKGDVKFGIIFLLLGSLTVLPFLYFSSFSKDFQREYPLPLLARSDHFFLILWELIYFLYYIGWEFLFRGYLLFGLERKAGSFLSILFQTVPSTLLHIGKPEPETVSAILAGIIFGVVALRTRSIIYVLLLHYLIGVSMDVFCVINRE